MQTTQAVMTLFGVPDTVGHAEGKMFATFGGLRVYLSTTEPIAIGPMKVDARLDGGVWVADLASFAGRVDIQVASRPVQQTTLELISAGAAPLRDSVLERSASSTVPSTIALPANDAAEVAPVIEPATELAGKPELTKLPLPLVTAPRSAFADLGRGSRHEDAASPAPATDAVASPAPAPAPDPTPAVVDAKAAVISGAAFSGLTRNRTTMPSRVHSPAAAATKVVQLKTGVAASPARPAFDPNETTQFTDIPF